MLHDIANFYVSNVNAFGTPRVSSRDSRLTVDENTYHTQKKAWSEISAVLRTYQLEPGRSSP